MAIDSRIALAGIGTAPKVSQAINIFENALMNSQTRDIRAQAMEQAAAQAPVRAQILQQQADTGALGLSNARNTERMTSLANASLKLQPILERAFSSGSTEEAKVFLNQRIQNLQDRQANGENVDPNDSVEALRMLDTPDGLAALRNATNDAVSFGESQGLFEGRKQTNKPADQIKFENLLNLAQDPNATQLERDSAKRALGDKARAGISAQERIAGSPELTTQVAESQAEIEGAKEGSKLTQKRKHLPGITKAVKLAEKAAIERGDTLNDLQRSKAAMPGLTSAVDELKELAKIATSTWGGKLFDTAVKQTGFGATKGATARAKFISIINNQVLPLLKPTFGGSFSVQEGESLKATMGDPDATPEEKIAQLDSFINQKVRDIETKQRQLEVGGQQDSGGQQLSEGAIIKNPTTGERMQVVNGEFVRVQ
jgi:hypothetical protein